MPQPTMEGTSARGKREHPRVQHVFPADNWYFWIKAAEDRPDEIITDLEDAVATPRKELARDIFVAILKLFQGEQPTEGEMTALAKANSPEGRAAHLPIFIAKMKSVKGLPLTEADRGVLRDAEASADKRIQALLDQVARFHSLDDTIVTLRINNLHTKWSAGDLFTVVRAVGDRFDRILLPKVEGPEDVILLHRILTAIEAERGWEATRIKIQPLIELPSAARQVDAIARSSPRMVSLIFGIVDWTAATGGRDQDHQGTYPLYARLRTIEAARAAGLEAIDGITPSLQRHRTFVDTVKAARLGFTGKWSVNPNNLLGILDFLNGRLPNRRDPKAQPVAAAPRAFPEVVPKTMTCQEYSPFPLAELERHARDKRPLLPPRVLELQDAVVRRSVVVASGGDPVAVVGALASAADEVVVNLEPVQGPEKGSARQALGETLRSANLETKLLALQADPDQPRGWEAFEEVLAALGRVVGSCVLPGVRSAADVRRLDGRLSEAERRCGIPVGHVRIEGRIRSEAALDQAYDIATASRRMSALIFDIGVSRSRGRDGLRIWEKTRSVRKAEYLLKGQLNVATSEAGIDAVDSFTKPGNAVSREALDAANMGFSGKLARPGEVEEINERMVPPRSFIDDLAPLVQGAGPGATCEALHPGAIRASLLQRYPAKWVDPFIQRIGRLAEGDGTGPGKPEGFAAALRAELQRRWYPASIERALEPFELFAVADQDRGLGAVAYSDRWRGNQVELVDAATARVYEHIIRTAWKAGLLTPEEEGRYKHAFERLRTALLVKEAAGLTPGLRLSGYGVQMDEWKVRVFAKASGDRNLYHLDEGFVREEHAKGKINFDSPIAHGVLTLIVSLSALPQVADEYRVRSVEEARYRAPVRIGDAVTPSFQVLETRDRSVKLKVSSIRQDGEIAMEATAWIEPIDGGRGSAGPVGPPRPEALEEAIRRSRDVEPFPRDKEPPAFARGETVQREFQAQISSEVANGYWALTGSAGPEMWNLAVALGVVAHTSANFASPGWILLSTRVEDFQEPIRPGDSLRSSARLEVIRLTREEKRPIVRIVMDVRNQHGRPVFKGEVAKIGDRDLYREPSA